MEFPVATTQFPIFIPHDIVSHVAIGVYTRAAYNIIILLEDWRLWYNIIMYHSCGVRCK